MRKPRPTSTEADDALARALAAVLVRERDPRARRWLEGLLAGDAPKAKHKTRPRKRAA